MLLNGLKARAIFATAVVLILSAERVSFAEGESYTEQLKKEIEPKGPGARTQGSYTEEFKKKLESRTAVEGEPEAATPAEAQGYTERLREDLPALRAPSPNGGVENSYLEREKKKLESKSQTGAIAAVAEGKSDLSLKKPGNISRAFGFRYGVASLTRSYSVSGSPGAVGFSSLYGANYVPEVSFLYEMQLFHSEILGSLGGVALMGLSYFSGKGIMSSQFADPRTGAPYSSTSKTTFQLFSVPATFALNYRLNILHYVRPYIMAGPTVVASLESRSDSKPSGSGLSYAAYLSFGASILLDWMAKAANWDLYMDHKIQHSYLTVDYIQFIPLGGAIKAQSSGVFVGFTFEY